MRTKCALRATLVVAVLGGGPRVQAQGTLLVQLGARVGIDFLETAFKSTGLFEAIGLSSPEDRELKEIISELKTLHDDLDTLGNEVQDLKLILDTLDPKQTVLNATTRILETCYRDRLDAVVNSVDLEVEERNQLLLARAYQVTGELLPPGMGELFDDGCDIQDSLNELQDAMVQQPLGYTGSLLVNLARQARDNGDAFDDVVSYFTWVVGTERQAEAIFAQAYHRLGHDHDWATKYAQIQGSLRRQEIELLRAAEAYVAYQPVNTQSPSTYDGSPLTLADQVVARLEGTTRFVSSGVLSVAGWPTPWDAYRDTAQLPTMTEDGQPEVTLDDALVADDGQSYYGVPQAAAIKTTLEALSYPFMLQLTPEAGVEIGRAAEVTLTHARTSHVSPPSSPTVTLNIQGVPVTRPTPTVYFRNAATMELEATGDPKNGRDRMLLAHPEGLGTAMALFTLVPTADDPRRVVLEVDEPAWGLSGVQVGALADNGPFAAFDGLEGTVLEMVPRGPAQPEQYALRLSDGTWLGVVSMQTEGETVPIWGAAVVDKPAWFDLERTGGGYHMSILDPADDVRKYLFVNEQLVSASDFQVQQAALPAELLRMGVYPPPENPQTLCPINSTPGKLWLPIYGGPDSSVTYTIQMSASSCGELYGARCLIGPGLGMPTETTIFDFRSSLCSPIDEVTWSASATLQEGKVHYLYCESYQSCAAFTSIQLSVQ